MVLIRRIKNPALREILDWSVHIIIAIVIALLITNFVFQRTVVYKKSMQPTLYEKDNLLVEKISPRIGNLKRGDIITIYAPERVEERGSTIIKRIVGIEGDFVEIKDGKVYLNGEVFKEDYINGNYTQASGKYVSVYVKKGEVYALGDNRSIEILDSREMGPIPIEKVTGKAVCRLYPVNKIKFF